MALRIFTWLVWIQHRRFFRVRGYSFADFYAENLTRWQLVFRRVPETRPVGVKARAPFERRDLRARW